ncbi:Uncharacterised protein [Mycobacterium tuberculosis]|nr:Uncharacterised protein [Mycobacterium tuberculosis]
MNVQMSSKTNIFALMQKCKISNAVPMKNVKTCNVIVARTWQKQSYHLLTTLSVHLQLKV